MRKKDIGEYCIGLDIGTNSVGWAVIDEDYKLLRLCGKDGWGALLMDNAETAAGRRLARSARRRSERRKERIRLLRELFAPLIAPVDEKFFVRLDESSLHTGTGEFFRENRYNIFDGEYTDKDYFRGKDTRTVYHLRKMLMETDKPADIRLVYLAVHHIVKYRGHFLLDGKAVDVSGNMLSGALDELFELLEGDIYGRDLRYSSLKEQLVAALQDKRLSRAAKRERAVTVFLGYLPRTSAMSVTTKSTAATAAPAALMRVRERSKRSPFTQLIMPPMASACAREYHSWMSGLK